MSSSCAQRSPQRRAKFPTLDCDKAAAAWNYPPLDLRAGLQKAKQAMEAA